MALTITKDEAQPLASDNAAAQPADLRLGLNISKFGSGLRHVIGSSLIGLTSAVATVGLLWTSWETGQNEAAFFTGFTAINTYWMIAYCRAACSTLINIYRNAYSRAEEADRQNAILRKQNLRLVMERNRRAEGEADDGVGAQADTSSASRFRRIHLKGEVH